MAVKRLTTRGEQTRRALLQAASRLFAEKLMNGKTSNRFPTRM